MRKNSNQFLILLAVLGVLFITLTAANWAGKLSEKESEVIEKSIDFYKNEAEKAFKERMEFSEEVHELHDTIYILEKKLIELGVDYEEIKQIKRDRAEEKEYKHYKNY